MKSIFSLLVLAFSVTCGSLTALAGSVSGLEDLLSLDQEKLDVLYSSSTSGEIPNGESDGRAIFFPGSILSAPATAFASLIWQGKVFSSEDGVLLNKVFGFNAIKAKVFKGGSLFDGNEAIIVDYQETSILAGSVRDEIRQVGQNLYLGRAYIRSIFGPIFAVNFALDFSSAEDSAN